MPLGNDNLIPPKENYASKFGKVNGNTKTQLITQRPVSKGNSTCTIAVNGTWGTSQAKGPCKNLPSPKPLMSQVRRPPSNEKGQQPQQQPQDLSQKTLVNTSTAHKTNSEDLTKKVEDSSPMEVEKEKDED